MCCQVDAASLLVVHIPQHSSIAFLYGATYTQLPYLIQIMLVLITVCSQHFKMCMLWQLHGGFHTIVLYLQCTVFKNKTKQKHTLTLKPAQANIVALMCIPLYKLLYVKYNLKSLQKKAKILLLTIKFPLKRYHWQNHLTKLEVKNHQIKSFFTLIAISLHANSKMAITWPYKLLISYHLF